MLKYVLPIPSFLRTFVIKGCLFQYHVVFVPESIYVVKYDCWFTYVEPPLCLWSKPTWSWWMISYVLNSVCKYYIENLQLCSMYVGLCLTLLLEWCWIHKVNLLAFVSLILSIVSLVSISLVSALGFNSYLYYLWVWLLIFP